MTAKGGQQPAAKQPRLAASSQDSAFTEKMEDNDGPSIDAYVF